MGATPAIPASGTVTNPPPLHIGIDKAAPSFNWHPACFLVMDLKLISGFIHPHSSYELERAREEWAPLRQYLLLALSPTHHLSILV